MVTRTSFASFFALLAFSSLWLLAAHPQAAHAEGTPSVVKIVLENGTYHLLCNGQPFFIKGAGGDASKKLLHEVGGNSFRTWGVDNLGPLLDEAQKQGLMVTAGIWLGHKEHGFNYNNVDQVAEQYEHCREAILKYKDHPALLMWGIGNEMEGEDKGDTAAIWSAVNNIASLAKRLDPNHPTMTVIAEMGGNKVQHINRLCPDIDIIGINSYGGGPTVATRYAEQGGVKPYVVTEYGPPGIWETEKNAWGVALELTSTAKADLYRKTYLASIQSQKLCLGSYAFTWGNKQEATATWFGMLLPDGSRLGAVDAMTELWTGKPTATPCPQLHSLKIQGSEKVAAGATAKFALDAVSPLGDPLTVNWVLQNDTGQANTNGAAEATPPSYADAIVKADAKQAELHVPKAPGVYRLYAYVHDKHGGAAVANIPFLVAEKDALVASKATAGVKLPLVVYDEAGRKDPTYVPSGYMGNVGAVKLNEGYTQNPHSGKTCLQAQYLAPDNWGGLVWQSPANDWGDKPGGKDLTNASKLTFWARGESGGEVVNFVCGVIGYDKPYYDTVQAKLNGAVLTKEWKQYTIDLKGKDRSRIKTGFGWSVAGAGAPITFYLDDILFE